MKLERLRGLNVSAKKLASGEERKYYYAWRGGPLLKDEQGNALQLGDPRFLPAFTAAHAERVKPAEGALQSLISSFRLSSEFLDLATRTKKDYERHLRAIEEEFGDMSLSHIQNRRARGDFKEWRDTLARRSRRQADYAWTVLARVLAVALDRGKISTNVCEKGGRLYTAERAEIIWTPEEITKFLEVASPPIRLALMLALWTGQRQGDLLRLAWSNYDGSTVRLRQGKTAARVAIPVGDLLKAALESAKPEDPVGYILINTRGEPWTEDGFRVSWRKAFLRSKIDRELHFHDLRGTAVTRLALSGCTTPQIAAITGHSMGDVDAILDAHYLGGQVELAEQAVLKLNTKYG